MGVSMLNPPNYANSFHAGNWDVDAGWTGGYYMEGINTSTYDAQVDYKVMYFDDDGNVNAFYLNNVPAGGSVHLRAYEYINLENRVKALVECETVATTIKNVLNITSTEGITIDGTDTGVTQVFATLGKTLTFKNGILTGVA